MDRMREKLGKLKKEQWIVLLLAGILIMVISIPEKRQETEKTGGGYEQSSFGNVGELETRLSHILSCMEGAGEVEVMITQKSSAEKIVEKDPSVNERSTTDEGDGIGSGTSEMERTETTIYERKGNGYESPYVIQEMAPGIGGVLVLAEGGGDPVISGKITEAVMALFDLDAHKIRVMKKNERRRG